MVITAPPAAVATPIPRPTLRCAPRHPQQSRSSRVNPTADYTRVGWRNGCSAIAAAGGLGEQADANGLKSSDPLKDGETLTIPTTSAGNPNAAETKPINLNTATLADRNPCK